MGYDDRALCALLRQAAGAFGSAGSGQSSNRWRTKSGLGCQGRQATGLRTRLCITCGYSQLLFARSQTVVLAGHFGRHHHAGVVPLGLARHQAFLCGITFGGIFTEYIYFPTGLQAQLRCGGNH